MFAVTSIATMAVVFWFLPFNGPLPSPNPPTQLPTALLGPLLMLDQRVFPKPGMPRGGDHKKVTEEPRDKQKHERKEESKERKSRREQREDDNAYEI